MVVEMSFGGFLGVHFKGILNEMAVHFNSER